MENQNELFSQAVKYWDLETLYNDLASAKGKHLTPVEKLHLRGLLCGYSPSEIAEQLSKNSRGVETDLCATIYKYVKFLLDKTDEKIENWRNISEWLEQSGYKCLSPQIPINSVFPEKSIVNIATVNVERDQIVFQINLRVPTSELTELSNNLENEEKENN
ncbi:helix-turn-helix domain-containing protein [Planktothrix pseudagardhii]|uniref:Helix-turn-helix domain containing protein n=1 Tax=Planktothrix pseudagardhii TaxID=132604 RepID=A0A9W4G425_9CYAN|nr:helix-turn-helix domain-containing protein [Planktothrix pseudagardhii]CAD5924935.1 hypothetical protein NO713_00908 [Planktothrix pseudagardhii]